MSYRCPPARKYRENPGPGSTRTGFGEEVDKGYGMPPDMLALGALEGDGAFTDVRVGGHRRRARNRGEHDVGGMFADHNEGPLVEGSPAGELEEVLGFGGGE
jgi:hypothetical protein